MKVKYYVFYGIILIFVILIMGFIGEQTSPTRSENHCDKCNDDEFCYNWSEIEIVTCIKDEFIVVDGVLREK